MIPRTAITLVLMTVFMAGCTVNVSPAPRPTILISATGRTIADGTALAFVFEPQADKQVTISVQASTDMANPDFRVVRGEIDFADLDETPISDLILTSADEGSGQEIDRFTPETAEAFTLFVEDAANWPGATFSITVSQ